MGVAFGTNLNTSSFRDELKQEWLHYETYKLRPPSHICRSNINTPMLQCRDGFRYEPQYGGFRNEPQLNIVGVSEDGEKDRL